MERNKKTNTKQNCSSCGKETDRLYQNDTCRECLVDSFSQIKQMINVYRDGYGAEKGAVGAQK